jgi:hypothetical protein
MGLGSEPEELEPEELEPEELELEELEPEELELVLVLESVKTH